MNDKFGRVKHKFAKSSCAGVAFEISAEFAKQFKIRRKIFSARQIERAAGAGRAGKLSGGNGRNAAERRRRKNRLRNFRRPVAFNSAMKTAISAILALSAAALLCSCESMGFSCGAVGPALTPDVDATTIERTWEKAPDSNREIPTEREVENPPAYR